MNRTVRWWTDFWRWRGFWESVEIFAAFVVGIGSLVIRVGPTTMMMPAVTTVGLSAVFVALSKAISKFIEFKKTRIRESEQEQLRVHFANQARRMVGAILKDLAEQYFRHVAEKDRYQSRVTLFRCIEPDQSTGTGKHLAIYARHGRYSDSTRAWSIDDNEPGACRGVAGWTWFHNTMDIVTASIEWPEEEQRLGEDHVLASKDLYAASTKLTIEEAETLNVKSLVFTGVVVEVHGRKWGVLLLDSCQPGQITSQSSKKGLLVRSAKTIGRILSEVD